MKKKRLLSLAVLLPTLSMASDFSSIVRTQDAGAEIQRSGNMITIVSTARRVTPHKPPFTELIPALCETPSVLSGLDKVIVLNEFAFKGVEFWTYDETEDLTGTCKKIASGANLQSYAVMH